MIQFRNDVLHFCKCGDLASLQNVYENYSAEYRKKWNLIDLLNDAFKVACAEGKLEVAQWLSQFYVEFHYNPEPVFALAMEHGRLNVVMWLFNSQKPDMQSKLTEIYSSQLIKCIGQAVKESNHELVQEALHVFQVTFTSKDIIEVTKDIIIEERVEALKWILGNYHQNPPLELYLFAIEKRCYASMELLKDIPENEKDQKEVFLAACKQGIVSIIDMYLYGITLDNQAGRMPSLREGFNTACLGVHLEAVQLIYPWIRPIYDNWYIYLVVRIVLLPGALQVIKWLDALPEITVNRKEVGKSIRCDTLEICSKGDEELIRWIHGTYHCSYNSTHFAKTCEKGSLSLVQWMYSTFCHKTAVDYDNEALYNACRGGNLPVIQWIQSIRSKQSKYVDPSVFIEVCQKGYLDAAKYLYKNGLQFDRIMLEQAFLQACRDDRVEVVAWLMTEYLYFRATFINRNKVSPLNEVSAVDRDPWSATGVCLSDGVSPLNEVSAADRDHRSATIMKGSERVVNFEIISVSAYIKRQMSKGLLVKALQEVFTECLDPTEVPCEICYVDECEYNIAFPCKHEICLTCFLGLQENKYGAYLCPFCRAYSMNMKEYTLRSSVEEV